MTCRFLWTFSDSCSRTLSIINHNLLNNKPSNYRKSLYSWAYLMAVVAVLIIMRNILGSPKAVCDGGGSVACSSEKAAGFQFPNEWLRIVGGREALPLGKITPTLHSVAKSCSVEAGLRPARGGRPLCSQRAPGLLTDSLVCTACNQS